MNIMWEGWLRVPSQCDCSNQGNQERAHNEKPSRPEGPGLSKGEGNLFELGRKVWKVQIMEWNTLWNASTIQSLGAPRRESFGPGFALASLSCFLKSSKAMKPFTLSKGKEEGSASTASSWAGLQPSTNTAYILCLNVKVGKKHPQGWVRKQIKGLFWLLKYVDLHGEVWKMVQYHISARYRNHFNCLMETRGDSIKSCSPKIPMCSSPSLWAYCHRSLTDFQRLA